MKKVRVIITMIINEEVESGKEALEEIKNCTVEDLEELEEGESPDPNCYISNYDYSIEDMK